MPERVLEGPILGEPVFEESTPEPVLCRDRLGPVLTQLRAKNWDAAEVLLHRCWQDLHHCWPDKNWPDKDWSSNHWSGKGLGSERAEHSTGRAIAQQLLGILKRGRLAQQVMPLTPEDWRGWHFVFTGGLLLRGNPETMTQAQSDACGIPLELMGLSRLEWVLRLWQLRMPRILMLPDPASATMARAAAQQLGCPLERWVPGCNLPGLIPVSDLGMLGRSQCQALAQHYPGQILWSHRHSLPFNSLADRPINASVNHFVVADITTMFCHSASPATMQLLPSEERQFQEKLPEEKPPEEKPSQDSLTLARQLDETQLAAMVRAMRPGEHGAAALKYRGDRRQPYAFSFLTQPGETV